MPLESRRTAITIHFIAADAIHSAIAHDHQIGAINFIGNS